MKLTAIAILKWNGANNDPILLGLAADLSNFGFFQRGSVKEMLVFVSRTVAQRSAVHQSKVNKHFPSLQRDLIPYSLLWMADDSLWCIMDCDLILNALCDAE